jgi:acetyltransferase-like isoleucine patch superfamily enzyme
MKIGNDVFIDEFSKIKRPHLAFIGSHVAIDWGFYCTTQLSIGNYIHISPYVTVIGGAKAKLKMGNFITIAAGCRLICGSDKFDGGGLVTAPGIPDEYRNDVFIGTITMEDYSSLGTNVVVMPGVTIGEGAVVGANSFVNKDIPAWTIYAGSPAKFIRNRPEAKMKEYGKTLLEGE